MSEDLEFAEEPAPNAFEQATPAERAVETTHGVNGAHPLDSARPAGRLPPHSIEAEEHLLSCLLIDADGTIARCNESGVNGRSFYLAAHRLLFDRAVGMHSAGKQTDAATLSEELKTTKELEAVGGYAFLMQVSSRVPTTAQAGYFIEKVREMFLLRETIAAATRTVEEAYQFTGGIEEFLAEARERLPGAGAGSGVILGRPYDVKVRLEKPEPIYQLAGTTICTPGNITTLYAQSKAGKSSFLAAMMGSSMTTPTSGHDTLGVTGPNYAKHAVIYIDTEMSPYDFQNLIDSALRRVGLKEPPAWFIAYTMTGVGAAECRNQVDRLLRLGKKLHGGVHSLFIDGVGDMVVNPNDEAECFPLVTKLQGQAIAYHTSIITVLHQNPGSDVKGRGHLGSQLERKSESNLTMEKTGNVTRIWATKQRGKMIMKDKAPAFQWSDDQEMHVTCEAEPADQKKNKGGRPRKYEFHQFVQCFPKNGEKAIPLPEAYRLARGMSAVPDTTFREIVADAERDGMLIRSKDDRRGFVYTLR